MSRLSLSFLLLRLFYGSLLLQAYTQALAKSVLDSGMGILGTATATPKKGHVPLDVNGYPVAPPELELEQVHIYVRHGMSRFHYNRLEVWYRRDVE